VSYPILQLGNSSNWLKFYSQYFRVEFKTPKEYIPLPPVTLPVQSEHRVLVAGCTSQTAKGSWYLGGWLRPIVETGDTDFVFAELDSIPVPLNVPRLILLPQIAGSYRLRFEVPFWHQEITLTIYQYIGPDVDSTEVLLGSLKSQLDQIQSRVNQLT
jgi:hypothetical protein